MAIVQYEKFFPYIQPYVPECPEFVIEEHLIEAAAQFCEETYLWRFDIEEDQTIAGEPEYDIDVPAGTVLEDILMFEIDGSPIRRLSDAGIAPQLSDTPAKPQYYSVYRDSQVRLYSTPDDVYTFRGVGVAKPKLGVSTGVEGFIFETFGRCISNGAIAQLADIPGKAWSNPALASNYRIKFSKSIADARRRDVRTVAQRVAPRPFA